MASTLDFALIREPQLLDLIDEAWAQEKLPDDGEPCWIACPAILLRCLYVTLLARLSRHPAANPFLADIPLPAEVQLLPDLEEEHKAKEPEKWHELGLQSVG